MYPWRDAAPSHRLRKTTSSSVQRPEWLDFSGFSLPEEEPVTFTGPSSPDSRADMPTTSPHSIFSRNQDIYGTLHARSAGPDPCSLPGPPTNTSTSPARSLSARHIPYSPRANEDDWYVVRSAMHFKKASLASIESVDRAEVSAYSVPIPPSVMLRCPLTPHQGTKHRDQKKHVVYGAPAPSTLENHARRPAS